MVNETSVLNAREAAAFLGAHVETVRRLARRGEIPSFKVGKDWRFRREALENWADRQQSSQSPQIKADDEAGLSVLVVDDDRNVGRMLARMLKRLGHGARQVTDGAEGLQLVAEEPPDLILLDLVMPEMNGPQFLEKLRATHPELPVVIVTGFPDSRLMSEAMRHAPVLLIPKPVEMELLERTVRTVVGKAVAAAG